MWYRHLILKNWCGISVTLELIPMEEQIKNVANEVSQILKYCNEKKIKVVPRGAGTGLSGGSLPLKDCVLISMSKFNKILEIDFQKKHNLYYYRYYLMLLRNRNYFVVL